MRAQLTQNRSSVDLGSADDNVDAPVASDGDGFRRRWEDDDLGNVDVRKRRFLAGRGNVRASVSACMSRF